jgi:regulator of sigma E protease
MKSSPLIAFTPEKVAIEIERADPQDPQKNIRKTFDVYPAYDEQLGFRAIGIQQSYNTSGTIVKGLAAYEAGLRTEDEILSINGEPASSNRDILKYTQDSLNPDPITIKVKDTSQKIKEIQIFPKASSYFIGVMMSQRFLKAVKGSATPYFQANDEILSVDEQKLHLFEKIHEYALTLTPALQPHLTFMIRRKDQVVAIPVPTSLLQERSFFLHLAPYQDTTALGFILEGKPAHAAGFQIADQVLAINGKKIKTFGEMSALISQSQGQALEFTLQRDGQEIQIRLTPEKRYLFELGIAIGPKLLDQPLKCESFLEAVSLGLRQFKEMSQQIFLMLISLFTREVHPSNLGGPVTIFQASYNFAQFGLGRMIHWLALISINLAILNILPIPVLDGGHLMFLFFEKLKGSPLQPKTLLLFQYVGLIFILILMVYVTFNDISRLLDFLQ